MSEAFDLDLDLDLDFGRYAPAQVPQLVWDNPAPVAPDALAKLGHVIRTSLALAFTCALVCAAIIRHRTRVWFEINILRSLRAAWAIAMFGWGGFIGLLVFHSVS